MTPTNPIELFTPFLPTTYNVPKESDQIEKFLVDTFCNISDVVNDKKIGVYTQNTESQNGELWSYDTTKKIRNGFQAIARIPSFVGTTINVSMPIKNINPQFVVSLTYGSASKACSAVGAGDGDYFSFMPSGDTRISYTMSDTTIIITTDGSRAAYSGFIIVEYIRDGT